MLVMKWTTFRRICRIAIGVNSNDAACKEKIGLEELYLTNNFVDSLDGATHLKQLRVL